LRSRIDAYFDKSSYQKKVSPCGLATSEVLDASAENTCKFGEFKSSYQKLTSLEGTDRYLVRAVFVDSERGPVENILSTAS